MRKARPLTRRHNTRKRGRTLGSILHPNVFCNDDLWKSTLSVCGLVWRLLRVGGCHLRALNNKTSKLSVPLKIVADKSQAGGDVAGSLQAL